MNGLAAADSPETAGERTAEPAAAAVEAKGAGTLRCSAAVIPNNLFDDANRGLNTDQPLSMAITSFCFNVQSHKASDH